LFREYNAGFKRHASEKLYLLIKHNSIESGREWLPAMMEKAGKENRL